MKSLSKEVSFDMYTLRAHQKRPVSMKRDPQKRPTKETYKRDLQKRPTKETNKRDLCL